jgi:dTDP-4-dehydrorhamnose reductase
MKLLVIGANGQVGYELSRALPALGQVTSVDFPEVDLTKPEDIRRNLREVRPDILVNAAAYTAVDKAESEPDIAMAINGHAPGLMAQEMAARGGIFVHYSTDYVYDGAKQSAYIEDDPTNPQNSYGRSKLAGDQAVRAAGGAFLVFRTSWVYGSRGSNFLLTMLRLFAQRPELRIVADQIGAPTWCRYIAQATARVLQQCTADHAATERLKAAQSGVYHLTAGGSTSWFGFASAIRELRYAGRPGAGPKLVPIPTSEYPLPARRPVNSVLSNDKLQRVFGIAQVPWEGQLKECFAEISGDG